jgi:hypothetical protein
VTFLPQEKYADTFQLLPHATGAKKKQITKIGNIILLEWPIWTNGSFYGIQINIVRMLMNGDAAIQTHQENGLYNKMASDGPNYFD